MIFSYVFNYNPDITLELQKQLYWPPVFLINSDITSTNPAD